MRLQRAAALAAPLVLAACGSAASNVNPDASPSALSASAQQVIDEANAMPLISEINGMIPPEKPTLVHTSALVLNVMRDGQQVRIYRDIREPGTRAPFHVHPFGGWTCVVSGQAILYLAGAEPQRVEAGGCVDMPALQPMSNANPGPGPSVLLDNFVTPPGAPVWRIVEQDDTALGNEFATGPAIRENN